MDVKKEKFLRLIVYHFSKTVILFFCFFVLLSWLTSNEFHLINNFIFSILIAGGMGTPILLALKIITPEINKETREERLRIFKKHNMAVKLIASLTACVSLLVILFWAILPVSLYGLSFLEVLGSGLGIGFMFGCLCALVVWFIIGLEKPPFQNWSK
jgi:hypothetical protein